MLAQQRVLLGFDDVHIARQMTEAYYQKEQIEFSDYQSSLLDYVYNLDWRNQSTEQRSSRTIDGKWEQVGFGATRHHTVRLLLAKLNLRSGDHFLDAGAGFGRLIIALGLLRPEVRFTGVEIVEERATFAKAAIARYALANTEMIHGSILGEAARTPIAHATVLFLFNPFSSETRSDFESYLNSTPLKLHTIVTSYTSIDIAHFRERSLDSTVLMYTRRD